MSRPNRIGVAACVTTMLLLLGISAAAAPNPASLLPGCGCTDGAEFTALRERIAEAPSLDEARELALAPVEQAHKALTRALWLVPLSDSIRAAQGRLSVYEADVRRARSGAEVADRFGELVQLANSGGVVADVDFDSGSCHYSTGEIIAIVLGLILGIIPGLILLVLLC